MSQVKHNVVVNLPSVQADFKFALKNDLVIQNIRDITGVLIDKPKDEGGIVTNIHLRASASGSATTVTDTQNSPAAILDYLQKEFSSDSFQNMKINISGAVIRDFGLKGILPKLKIDENSKIINKIKLKSSGKTANPIRSSLTFKTTGMQYGI